MQTFAGSSLLDPSLSKVSQKGGDALKKHENKPPQGGHQLLPAWLLRSQVCTPTQFIGPISDSVPKTCANWGK